MVTWNVWDIALEKVEVSPPILNPFEESEFSQSVSRSEDREDNANVQIYLSNYNTGGFFCHLDSTN